MVWLDALLLLVLWLPLTHTRREKTGRGPNPR